MVIRYKLIRLQRTLTSSEYRVFISDYQSHLRFARNLSRQLRERLLSIDEKHGEVEWNRRMDELAVMVMYWAIDVIEKWMDDRDEKRSLYHQQQMAVQYDTMISDIVRSNIVNISSMCSTADSLTELLDDLQDIDNILKIAKSKGDIDQTSERTLDFDISKSKGDLDRTLEWLQYTGEETGLDDATSSNVISGSFSEQDRDKHPPLDDIDVNEFLSDDLASNSLPDLAVERIEDYLNEDCDAEVVDKPSLFDIIDCDVMSRLYRSMHGLDSCCSLESPSCMLSSLLLYDKLHEIENTSVTMGNSQQSNEEPHKETMRELNVEAPSSDDAHISEMATSGELSLEPAPPRHGEPATPCHGPQAMMSIEVYIDEANPNVPDQVFHAEGEDDGIYGADIWLTNPIGRHAAMLLGEQDARAKLCDWRKIRGGAPARGGCQTVFGGDQSVAGGDQINVGEAHSSGAELGSWMYGEDQEEFSFLRLLNDDSDPVPANM